jgi:L-lactate dehydrogenase complex protein LldE
MGAFMRVSLFVTCLTDLFYPDVAACVVRILRRLGLQVDFPKDQTCCGQPALNSGFTDEFRSVAGRMIDVFQDAPVVVTPSGSCCSIVREYFPRAFEDDPAMHKRAEALAARTFEFVEYLEKVLKVDWSKWDLHFPAVATYHYSCHLRGIGMTDEAVRLLTRIRGIEYRPMEKMDQCCGFGGTFSVKYGELSGAMVRDKVACIRATGADVVMVNDGGCAMNIGGALHREGVPVKVMHIAEILDQAMKSSGGRVQGSGIGGQGSGAGVQGSAIGVQGSGCGGKVGACCCESGHDPKSQIGDPSAVSTSTVPQGECGGRPAQRPAATETWESPTGNGTRSAGGAQ